MAADEVRSLKRQNYQVAKVAKCLIILVITCVQRGGALGLLMKPVRVPHIPRTKCKPLWSILSNRGSEPIKSRDAGNGLGNHVRKAIAILMLCPLLLGSTLRANGDDELAKYAAEGNKVGVDTQCFFRKCAVETAKCANDPNCLKGLSCLARCKGGSMCSTGCFAKYGSKQLDEILSCSVERHDCVQVPGKEIARGWAVDTTSTLPTVPLSKFDLASLEGGWFKVMGLDSRYDCFDCQKNTFTKSRPNSLRMEALFRIPRPTAPGYVQNKIEEELVVPSIDKRQSLTDTNTVISASNDQLAAVTPHLQSKGEMFGLTFWENWYVIGESPGDTSISRQVKGALFAHADGTRADSDIPEMKLVYYTGHTLQGSYKGAFLYSRSSEMTPRTIQAAMQVIREAGLNPADFCIIRNQCFNEETRPPKTREPPSGYIGGADNAPCQVNIKDSKPKPKYVGYDTPFWFLGQNFFRTTTAVATELADWFQDPALLSDWLVKQQVRMVLQQPMEVSPFAELPDTLR